MKKIILIFIFLLVTGCSAKFSNNGLKNVMKKYSNFDSYVLKGTLKIYDNEDKYTYNVISSFKKDDLYKVELTNTMNDRKQIILKNDDGVYIITPALNKSFRFQSEWPSDNSQVYLLNSILNDIKNDKNIVINKDDGKFFLETKVNYKNDSSLKKQKLYFDIKNNLEKVVVYNSDNIKCLEFDIESIKLNKKLKDEYFSIDDYINDDGTDVKKTSSLDDVIYPLYLPSGTKLVDEKKMKKDYGERVIMTYDGEKSFLLVEETQDVFDEFTVIPSSGEPYQLLDSYGVLTNNSLSWNSNDIDYYIVSDVMSTDELHEIAQSIIDIPNTK